MSETQPRFEQVRAAHTASYGTLLDRHGVVVQRLRVDFQRAREDWVPLSEFSPAMIEALLLAEDRRFYAHSGVDTLALGASLWRHLRGGARGGSTLSMQLVRLLQPAAHPRHDLLGKLNQVWNASVLELRWRKSEILEAYLNLVPLRAEMLGVPAAARFYFDKNVSGLHRTEGAVLAALMRAPNAPRRQVERRACVLLRSMGSACDELSEAVNALRHPRANFGAAQRQREQLAPHLARRLLGGLSAATYGPHVARSTLSASTQSLAAAALREQLLELTERNVHDGAVVVLDNASGDVLAYVGSADGDVASSAVDAVRAPRQAGSTLKPFLYALAFERGLLAPESLVDDSPLQSAGSSGLYSPQNYDRSYRGLVTVREALAGSLNIPAVRTLDLLGTSNLHALLAELDFKLPQQAEHYGLGLALGAAEVNLLNLTNAYRMLANAGRWSPVRFEFEGSIAQGRQVLGAQTARSITHILADRSARANAFGFGSALSTRTSSAVKTGTSKGMRDNWCIGYGSQVTIGVWVGNANGEAMWDVSGVSGAAPVWARLMDAIEGIGVSVDGSPRASGTVIDGIAMRPPVRSPIAAITRIDSPVEGSRYALDPDAPAHRQKLSIRARVAATQDKRAPSAWRLDGQGMVFEASGQLIPLPRPGVHTLELLDTTGKVVDRVKFHVQAPK